MKWIMAVEERWSLVEGRLYSPLDHVSTAFLVITQKEFSVN